MANITRVLINGKEVSKVLVNRGIWFQKNSSSKPSRNFSVSLTDNNYNPCSLINNNNSYQTPGCLPYKGNLIATFSFSTEEGTIIPDSIVSSSQGNLNSTFSIYDGEVNFQVRTDADYEPNFTDSIGNEQGNLRVHCSGYYDTDTKVQTLVFYINYCNVALSTLVDSHYFYINVALYGQGKYEPNSASLEIYFGSAAEL